MGDTELWGSKETMGHDGQIIQAERVAKIFKNSGT